MAIIRATAILEHAGGKPENASRNVWHFATAGAPNTDVLTKIGNAVGGFYTEIGALLGAQLLRAVDAHRVEMAAVTQGAPGEADDTVTELLGTTKFNIPAAAGGNTPSEVAIALSFQGDVEGIPEEESGGLIRPRSSRRGRVFLGPVGSNTIGFDAPTNRVIVAAAARTTITGAYTNAYTAWTAGPADNARHVIYSRKQAVVHPVVKRWVDDAFDTIRTRGEDTAARTGADVSFAVVDLV